MVIYVKFLSRNIGAGRARKTFIINVHTLQGEKMGEMPYIYIIAYVGYFVNSLRVAESKNPCGHGFY